MTRQTRCRRGPRAWTAVLLALVLAACGGLPGIAARDRPDETPDRGTDSRSSRGADTSAGDESSQGATVDERRRRTRPIPGARRCPPGQAIGVLAAEGGAVFINGAPARDGDEVCDGDSVTTGDGSSAQVLIGADRDGDTVQLDANTDPRFKRLPSGCVLVDGIRKGRLLAEQRRARSCLIFEVQNKLYYQRAATVHIYAMPAGAAPARTEVSVIKGELRPLQATAVQVQSVQQGELEKLKRPPVTVNNTLILVTRKPEVVQFQPSAVKRSADWTRQFKLKSNTLDLKPVPRREIPQ